MTWSTAVSAISVSSVSAVWILRIYRFRRFFYGYNKGRCLIFIGIYGNGLLSNLISCITCYRIASL